MATNSLLLRVADCCCYCDGHEQEPNSLPLLLLRRGNEHDAAAVNLYGGEVGLLWFVMGKLCGGFSFGMRMVSGKGGRRVWDGGRKVLSGKGGTRVWDC